MRKKAGALILLVGLSIGSVLGGSVELAGEGFIPEPNQEITVQIQTDTPLFVMDIGIYVIGDANITAAMSEADCNEFGWDNGWNYDPYIDPNGWVEIVGVRWDADANGTVGYFKFRYNSGQVTVSIDEDSIAYDANCEPVPFSDKTLVFGLPDPNDCNEQGEPSSQDIIPDENTPASTEEPNDCNEQGEPSSQDIVPDENTPASAEGPNDVNTPSNNYRQDKEAERQKRLRYFPVDSNSSRGALSRAEWEEQLEKDGGGQMLMGSEPNIIDVNSDITSNQIWTANNIYRVIAEVNVTALLVIEPGTVISFNNHGSLFINNGGALISCGTPDEPIYYTSAYIDPYPGNYYYAIYVEETASPATKVTYSYIEYAQIGVVTDNIRLDTPIENNIFFDNKYGVYEYGTHHSDIINNLVYDSTGGIDVNMESSSGAADENSHILIENNTCNGNECFGIRVRGTADVNNAGQVTLVNNIVSSSQTGIALVNGWMYPVVTNTGYYANVVNINDFNDTNPVEANDYPYVLLSGCHLKQDCPFIDAGWGYVEETPLIGMTTDYYNSLPDSDKVDIGFHHPNWGYSNAGSSSVLNADYDGNGIVNFRDFAILANGWRQSYDINELSTMTDEWLAVRIEHPEISVSVSGDVNSLNGEAGVSIGGCLNSTARVFIFMDGQLMGETDYREDEGSPGITINTPSYRNGSHLLKGVIVDYNGLVTVSENLDVNFNNFLNSVTLPYGFVPSKDFYLYALGTGNHSVEILDIINNEVVYTNSFQNGINAQINSSTFSEPYGVYKITATETGGMLTMGTSTSFSTTVGRVFRMEDYPPDCNSKMVVSIGSEELEGAKEKCWQAALKAGIDKKFNPILLRYKDCTWNNLSYCLHLNGVKIWYHCSHGNYDLRLQPPRQCIETFDGKVFSYLKKDLNPVPPDYQELWYYEKNHSIAELGFWTANNTNKLIWVQFNACYSARTTEFPVWLGILPIDDPPLNIGKQIFIGWKDGVLVYDLLGNYNQFEEDYWDKLRWDEMLENAVNDSLPPGGGTNIDENFTQYGVISRQYAFFRYPNIN